MLFPNALLMITTIFGVLVVLSRHHTTAAAANYSYQNDCMIKHMMRYYTSSDKLTLANMEHLFDAVTTGYHDRAPAHIGSSPMVSLETNRAPAYK